MVRFYLIYLLFLCPCSFVLGQQIILDEDYADWGQGGVTSFIDAVGDANFTGIDFTDVRICNDEDHLFLYIDLSKETNLQSSNSITLYIDIDNNPNTGLSKFGVGAEIVYFFGSRNGVYYGSNFNRQIYHNDLNLITLPTVTSDKFEMSLTRKFTYGNSQTSMGDDIKVLISDESINGDRAPNQNGGYLYTFNNAIKNNFPSFSIIKQDPSNLRVMTYNVLRDNMFEAFTQGAYKRIFEAVTPDIIGFCEIYDYSSQQTADRIESYLPSLGNKRWYHAEVNPDIRVVSRYPIIDKRSIDGNGAFLIDLGPKQLVFIVVHFPCCENDFDRQKEVDNVMSFVRNVRFGLSPFQVAQNTPIIICGDTNFVGFRSQQQTLISGDIKNNAIYGEDFDPDWDDTQLEDAKPIVTNLPSTFTWNNPNGSFSAGRLDYVFYTGSVLELKNSFSLWTSSLNSEELNFSGLQTDDIAIASDHLPLICDFSVEGISNISESNLSDELIEFKHNGDELTVVFKDVVSDRTEITLSDMMGRELESHYVRPYEQEKMIAIHDLGPIGIYILTIRNLKGIKSFRFFK